MVPLFELMYNLAVIASFNLLLAVFRVQPLKPLARYLEPWFEHKIFQEISMSCKWTEQFLKYTKTFNTVLKFSTMSTIKKLKAWFHNIMIYGTSVTIVLTLTFQNFIVLSFVDSRNNALFAAWHHFIWLIFSSISKLLR